MVDAVEDFLSATSSSDNVGSAVEPFRLEVALKGLSSESFEKRINGITVINDLIERVRVTEKAVYVTRYQAQQISPVKWLTSSYVIRWELVVLVFTGELD